MSAEVDANEWYRLVSINGDQVEVAAIVRCYAVVCRRCDQIDAFESQLEAESAAYQHAMDCRP